MTHPAHEISHARSIVPTLARLKGRVWRTARMVGIVAVATPVGIQQVAVPGIPVSAPAIFRNQTPLASRLGSAAASSSAPSRLAHGEARTNGLTMLRGAREPTPLHALRAPGQACFVSLSRGSAAASGFAASFSALSTACAKSSRFGPIGRRLRKKSAQRNSAKAVGIFSHPQALRT